MYKRHVEQYMELTHKALNSSECRILVDGKCSKEFRSCISSFGSAVTMGSFKQAVCDFCESSASDKKRSLIRCVYAITHNLAWKEPGQIAEEIVQLNAAKERDTKRKFENAAIALKLMLNAYIDPSMDPKGGGKRE